MFHIVLKTSSSLSSSYLHHISFGISSVGDVNVAFSDATTPTVFRAKYGHAKPAEEASLIFMCKIGRRSEMAANAAIALGFKK